MALHSVHNTLMKGIHICLTCMNSPTSALARLIVTLLELTEIMQYLPGHSVAAHCMNLMHFERVSAWSAMLGTQLLSPTLTIHVHSSSCHMTSDFRDEHRQRVA